MKAIIKAVAKNGVRSDPEVVFNERSGKGCCVII